MEKADISLKADGDILQGIPLGYGKLDMDFLLKTFQNQKTIMKIRMVFWGDSGV